jgi:DNA uptake protein ComE-like DNA-binding protein
MIFVTALGVIIILSSMVLVFAHAMRTELISSANRLAYAEADTVEQGAEQWVLATVESYPGDAVTITQALANAMPVGNGYFWVLTPDYDSDQTFTYGITDECAKINLNKANSNHLQLLPNFTEEMADSIVDWRQNGSNPQAMGAESDYYNALTEPYDCKNASYETVEEVLLVNAITKTDLFGLDTNRNGVVDEAEQAAANNNVSTAGATQQPQQMQVSVGFGGTTNSTRGFFNDITVYSIDPSNTAVDGTARVNINSASTTGLSTLLTDILGSSRSAQIIAALRPFYPRNTGRGGTGGATTIFASIGAFYEDSGMTPEEFGQVADYLSTSTAKTTTGLVNINTAPEEVLDALGSLEDSDAQALVAARQQGEDLSSIAWIYDAVSTTTATALSSLITSRSFQYSADIVAVSGDGRSFKRVRIVVDSSPILTGLPATIVYRKDLTSLGWPLPPQVLQQLKAGQKLQVGSNNPNGL